MWGETVANMTNADYMVFPRLLALAEVAWSPAARRTAASPAYRDFLLRLGAQGARLQAAGVNFYPSAEVPWPLNVIGTTADRQRPRPGGRPGRDAVGTGLPDQHAHHVRLLARNRLHDQVGRRHAPAPAT